MTGELHEISRAIGRLESEAEAARKDREKVMGEMRAMNVKLDVIPRLTYRLNKIEPMAYDWNRTKNRALGALAMTGVTSAGVGIGIGPWVRHLFAKILG